MYNKIFTKILDSSIWLETDATRLVWLTMIAAMDENGFCQFAAPGNVSNRARVSLEATIEAIRVLEGPDKNSADPDNDGRRLERVPGGWMVMNAAKYRDIVTRAVSQEQTRERVARFRAKNRRVTHGNADVTPRNVRVTPSEAEAEAEADTSQSPPSGGPTALQIYEAYPRHVARADALRAISKAISAGTAPDTLLSQTLAYAIATSLWPADDKRFIPHPATWFNRQSYLDDPATWQRKAPERANSRRFSQRNDYSGITDN